MKVVRWAVQGRVICDTGLGTWSEVWRPGRGATEVGRAQRGGHAGRGLCGRPLRRLVGKTTPCAAHADNKADPDIGNAGPGSGHAASLPDSPQAEGSPGT
ncbi:hypothetical protein GCM10027610_138340 [Dactylosporangium cerinum]